MVAGDEDLSITLRLITSQYVDIRQNEDIGLDFLSTELSRYSKELEAQEQRAREESEKMAREMAAKEKAERETADETVLIHEEKRRSFEKAEAEQKGKKKKLNTEKPITIRLPDKTARQSAKNVEEESERKSAITAKLTPKRISFIAVSLTLTILIGYLSLHYLQIDKVIAEVNSETIAINQWQERVRLQRVNYLAN